MQEEIDSLREKIDEIDGRLTELLKQRMDIVTRISEVKVRINMPVFDPVREREKLEAISGLVGDEYVRRRVINVFTVIMEESRGLQNELTGIAQESGQI